MVLCQLQVPGQWVQHMLPGPAMAEKTPDRPRLDCLLTPEARSDQVGKQAEWKVRAVGVEGIDPLRCNALLNRAVFERLLAIHINSARDEPDRNHAQPFGRLAFSAMPEVPSRRSSSARTWSKVTSLADSMTSR